MNGMTLLHQACLHGHRKLVELLIEHNANINVTTNTDRLSPLHYVCQYNHKDVRMCLSVCWSVLKSVIRLCCMYVHTLYLIYDTISISNWKWKVIMYHFQDYSLTFEITSSGTPI